MMINLATGSILRTLIKQAHAQTSWIEIHNTIGSNCHESAVAATAIGLINLPHMNSPQAGISHQM